jgi:hypothetical protein
MPNSIEENGVSKQRVVLTNLTMRMGYAKSATIERNGKPILSGESVSNPYPPCVKQNDPQELEAQQTPNRKTMPNFTISCREIEKKFGRIKKDSTQSVECR